MTFGHDPDESVSLSQIKQQRQDEIDAQFNPCSKCCPQIDQSVVLIATAWTVLAVLLATLNQYIFHNHMHFAIFLIMLGLGSTFVGSVICAIFIGKGPNVFQVSKYWRLLLLFAALHAAGQALGNVSSQNTGLTLNQIVKSALPLVTLIFSWKIEGESFSKKMVVVTSFLAFGALLALYHNPDLGTGGFAVAILSMLFQALETVILSMLLKQTTFSVLDVALTTSIPSVMMLAVPFILFEYDVVLSNAEDNPNLTFALLAASSILSFFFNISHFTLIWYTSAHYSVVIGHLKIVLILLSSMIVFGTPLGTVNYIGIGLVVFGFVVLNVIKLQEIKIDPTPILSSNDPPSLTAEMFESRTEAFSPMKEL